MYTNFVKIILFTFIKMKNITILFLNIDKFKTYDLVKQILSDSASFLHLKGIISPCSFPHIPNSANKN